MAELGSNPTGYTMLCCIRYSGLKLRVLLIAGNTTYWLTGWTAWPGLCGEENAELMGTTWGLWSWASESQGSYGLLIKNTSDPTFFPMLGNHRIYLAEPGLCLLWSWLGIQSACWHRIIYNHIWADYWHPWKASVLLMGTDDSVDCVVQC